MRGMSEDNLTSERVTARVPVTPKCHRQLKQLKEAEDKTFDTLLRDLLAHYRGSASVAEGHDG